MDKGDTVLDVYCRKPGDLSFVTLRDLHSFVCKERDVSFNTVSKACSKLTNKCADRQLIRELHGLGGISGVSATSFLYIKAENLAASLNSVKMSASRVQQVSDALHAMQASLYARQSAAQQQLTALQGQQQNLAKDPEPSVTIGKPASATLPIPVVVNQAGRQRAIPDDAPVMSSSTTGGDVNPLQSLLQYGSDSEASDAEDTVPRFHANYAPVCSHESGQDNTVQQQPPMNTQQTSPAQAQPRTQYMKPLEQRYTSIPDIDWRQRCPHLMPEGGSEKKALKWDDLAGTPVRCGRNRNGERLCMW